MTRKVILGLITIFLLTIPLSSGQEVTNLELTKYDSKVELVSTQNYRTADMHFTYQGPSFDEVTIDTGNLYVEDDNPVKTISRNNCVKENDAYHCTLTDLRIQPPVQEGNTFQGQINFRFIGDEIHEDRVNYNFEIDNTQPVIENIGTPACEEDCNIGPNGKLKIKIQDEKASFNNGYIFYHVNEGSAYMVDSCNSTTCTASINYNCQQGENVKVDIGDYQNVPSQDDAGNPVRFNEGEITETFTCDRTKPEIQSFTVTSEGTPQITENETVTIQATVKDNSAVLIKANAKSFNEKDKVLTNKCTPNGESQQCTLKFKANKSAYRQARIQFTFEDEAGNTVSTKKQLEILEEATGDVNNLWTVRNVQASPTQVNTKTLQYFEKKVYASTALIPELGGAGVVQQKLQGCQVEEPNMNLEAELMSTGKTFQVKTTLPTSLSQTKKSKIFINCTVETHSKRRTRAVSNSEIDSFSYQINLEDFPDRPEKLQEELKNIQSQNKKWNDYFGTVQKWTNTFTTICRAGQKIKGITGLLGGVEQAFCSNPVTAGAAPSLKPPADATGKSSDALWTGLGKFCKFLTCNTKVQEGLEDWVTSLDFGSGASVDSITSSLGLPKEALFRPENSLVWSAATLCLPGMVSNLQRYRVIQCEYQRCIQQDSIQAGIPSYACREVKSRSTCQFTTGQISKLIPQSLMFQQAGNLVKQALSNPIGLLGAGINTVFSCASKPACSGHVACTITDAVSKVGQYVSMFKGISNTATSMKNGFNSAQQTGPCKAVKEQGDVELYDPVVDSQISESEKSSFRNCQNGMCSNGNIRVGPNGNTELLAYPDDSGNGNLHIKYEGSYRRIERTSESLNIDMTQTIDENNIKSSQAQTITIVRTQPTVTVGMQAGLETTGSDTFSKKQILEKTEAGTTPATEKVLADRDELQEQAQENQERKQQQREDQEESNEAAKQHGQAIGQLNKLENEVERWASNQEDYTASDVEDFMNDLKSYCSGPACNAIPKVEEVNNGKVIFVSGESMEASQAVDYVTDQINQARDERKEELQNLMEKELDASDHVMDAIRTGISFSRVGNTAVDILDPDWGFLQDYKEIVPQKIGQIFDVPQQAIGKACKQNFDLQTTGTLPGGPSVNFQPAMHLEAYKQAREPGSEYSITAVVTPPVKDNATFNIVAKGEEEKVVVEDVTVTNTSGSYSRTRTNTIKFRSENQYDKVCFRFEKIPENGYGGISLENNEFCNEVKEVEV